MIRETHRLRRALALAAASCLAGIAIAAGVGWIRDGDALPEPRAASTPADDIIDAPPAAPVPTRAVQAPPPPLSSPMLNITRRGAEWRIEAVGVSRLVAAQRLAQASGSPMFGDVALLAAAHPLHLRWQGRGAASAWQAVLGQEVSFATQCGAVHCRVWIIGASATEQDPAPTPRLPPLTPPAMVDVAAAPPPPSDSPEPRIAAHHD